MGVFSDMFRTADVEKAVMDFPVTFERARADWAKFKAGYQAKLFTSAQIKSALDWYREFPKLWETVRPSFEDVMLEKTGSVNVNFVPTVDAWVKSLGADPIVREGLGFAPVVIGAVLIAGGIAAGLWAVGYIKRQSNISAMIDAVVAGKLPASVLQDAINKESETDFFGDIGGILKWLAVGTVIFFAGPPLLKMLQSRQAKHA
jgi:hypothetical protein